MCFDCLRWLLPCILHPSTRTQWRYRMGGGSAGGGGSTMEFFSESLRPGPLPALALLRHPSPLQLRTRPPRPLDQDFNTQWHCMQSVSPSVQQLFPGVLFSILPLQSRAACGSSCESLPILCPQKTCSASPYALQGPCQGRTAPAQLQSWMKTGSCCVWKAEFYI